MADGEVYNSIIIFGTYTFCVSFNISWNDYILITHDEIEKISDK